MQLCLTLNALVVRSCGVVGVFLSLGVVLGVGDAGAAVKIQLVLQIIQAIHLIHSGTFTGMKNVSKKSEK